MFCLFQATTGSRRTVQSVGKEIPDQARKKLGGEGRKEKSSKTQVSKYIGKQGSVPHAHAHTLCFTLSLTDTHVHTFEEKHCTQAGGLWASTAAETKD